MNFTTKFHYLLVSLLLVWVGSGRAVAQTPSLGTIVLDGHYDDWNLEEDFFAKMYKNGQESRVRYYSSYYGQRYSYTRCYTHGKAKVYLRYDCFRKKLAILVLATDGAKVLMQPRSSFVQLNGQYLLNGNSSAFKWISPNSYYGVAKGWEALVDVAPGDYPSLNIASNLYRGYGTECFYVKNKCISLKVDCDTEYNCPVVTGVVRHSVLDAYPGSHGLWLPDFFGNGQIAKWGFLPESYFKIFADGTALLRGKVKLNYGYAGYRYKWDVNIWFKYNAEGKPKTNAHTLSTEDWRYFRIIPERSKMWNTALRKSVLFKPMPRQDGGKYDFQVGTQAALIGEGGKPGVFGGATWFLFSKDHGCTWKGGDINVLFPRECSTLEPVTVESVCPDIEGKYKWTVTNTNDYYVLLTYITSTGDVKKVWAKNVNDGGYTEFYTDKADGEEITLTYASTAALDPVVATVNLEQCGPDVPGPVCDESTVSYRAVNSITDEYAWTPANQSIALHNFFDGDKNATLTFENEAFLSYEKDGSEAFIHGVAKFDNGPEANTRWEVTSTFGPKISGYTVPKKELRPEAYSEVGGPVDPSAWTIFLLQEGAVMKEIHENGTYTGREMTLSQMPADGKYGFQIGDGANGKNINFGAAGWFTWTLDGKSSSGDFQIDLTPICAPVCDNSFLSFKASSFGEEYGHSIWLKDFAGQGTQRLHFGEEAYLSYSKDLNKAVIYGEIASSLLGETGWSVYVPFKKAGSNILPKHQLDGTNADGQSQDDLDDEWSLFELDGSGKIVNADGTKEIILTTMNVPYGLQIGMSANGMNWKFGASTWFVWNYNGQSDQGDINIDLDPFCVQPDREVEFRLVNAETDELLMVIEDGMEIDVREYGLDKFNVVVSSYPTGTESLGFSLGGAMTHTQTESFAPYSLFGELGSNSEGVNYDGVNATLGTYTLTGAAFSEDGLAGDDLGSKTISFSLVGEIPAYPMTIKLVDTDTGSEVATITNGMSLSINDYNLEKFNILVEGTPEGTESLKLVLDGPVSHVQTESKAPYYLFGDNNSEDVVPGAYTFTTTAFGQEDLAGLAIGKDAVSFSFVQTETAAQARVVNTEEGSTSDFVEIITEDIEQTATIEYTIHYGGQSISGSTEVEPDVISVSLSVNSLNIPTGASFILKYSVDGGESKTVRLVK